MINVTNARKKPRIHYDDDFWHTQKDKNSTMEALRETSTQTQLDVQMATYKIDIFGVSEMRWNGSGAKMSPYDNTTSLLAYNF